MAAVAVEDKELEDLLDSALDDFEKTKPAPPPESAACLDGDSEKPVGDAAKDAIFATQEKFFQELFDSEMAAQATVEFEKAMKELAQEEPHLVEQFQKLSEAASKVGGDPTSQQEFSSCLKETLTGLAKNANDLQNSSLSEDEVAKAMEGLGLDEGDSDGNILPIMQNIMQNLLSKDVLYPSLKEITEKSYAKDLPGAGLPFHSHPQFDPKASKDRRRRKYAQYPEWLQTNQESLPADQYNKYQEQHNIMGKICEQFESEQPSDSDVAQKARFELVLDLMQQVLEGLQTFEKMRLDTKN